MVSRYWHEKRVIHSAMLTPNPQEKMKIYEIVPIWVFFLKPTAQDEVPYRTNGVEELVRLKLTYPLSGIPTKHVLNKVKIPKMQPTSVYASLKRISTIPFEWRETLRWLLWLFYTNMDWNVLTLTSNTGMDPEVTSSIELIRFWKWSAEILEGKQKYKL